MTPLESNPVRLLTQDLEEASPDDGQDRGVYGRIHHFIISIGSGTLKVRELLN